MKNTTLFVIAVILLIFAGYYLFGNGSAKEVDAEVNGNIAKGDVQEIKLGMKNFNYYPNTIKVKAGQPVRISLDSTVTGCLRAFTIPAFGVSKYMKSPKEYVDFTPNKKGTFSFACTMGMASGKITVE